MNGDSKKPLVAVLSLAVAGAFIFVLEKVVGIERDARPDKVFIGFEIVALSLVCISVSLNHVLKVFRVLMAVRNESERAEASMRQAPDTSNRSGWEWPERRKKANHEVSFREVFFLLIALGGSLAIYAGLLYIQAVLQPSN